MKIANDITELIGNTPLIRLNRMACGIDATVVCKLEYFNPGFSVKDRIGLAMILDAEANGTVNKDTVIIESTSGNTGIALGIICASRGYRLIITMPESMSLERRKILSGVGADVRLTPAHLGMKGAVEEAEKLKQKYSNSFIPGQFANPANPEIHKRTTAEEIWRDTDGRIDVFVAGVGTGGTITGVSEALKKKNPGLLSVAVEPKDSNVLSGGRAGPHRINGIGAGFVPEVLNTEIIDEVIQVSNDDAYTYAQRAVREEGILCGISSGAALFAAIKVAKRAENRGNVILALLPDMSERYVSANLFQ